MMALSRRALPPRLHYQSHLLNGKGHLLNGKGLALMRTPRICIPPIYHLGPTAHVSRPTCGQLGKQTMPHEKVWLPYLIRKKRIIDLIP